MFKRIFFIFMILNNLKLTGLMTGGGFSKQDSIELCQKVLNKILTDNTVFKDYEIKSCETQIVNGTNYHMNLENNSKDIKNCDITIYESLDKSEVNPIKNREMENDCFTKFDKVKITSGVKVEEQNQNSSTGLDLKIFFMFTFFILNIGY